MHRLALLAIFLCACQGRGATPAPEESPNNGTTAGTTNNGTGGEGVELLPFRPPASKMRRLSHVEYANTIHDIFGDYVAVPEELEPDTSINGFTSIGNAQLATSRRGVEQYEAAALEIAAQVMRNPARVNLVDCTPDGVLDGPCTATALRDIGRRLFRRPLSDVELQSYQTIALGAARDLNDFWSGLEFGLAALLQSPSFLYRTEWGDESAAPGRRKLTGYEMASRLSYFLLASTPDEGLLNAAAAGELETPEQVRAQAERLLENPRAKRGLRTLWIEFLGLQRIDEQVKDPALFPEFDAKLSASMREETLRLIEYYAAGDRDFREIYTTRTTFVDASLADIYGLEIDAPAGDFVQVELPEDVPRRGILGHASFLSLNAHAAATSPTHRGLFVRQSLLCLPIPPPPPNVDTTIEEYGGEGVTLRERLSVHMENEGCSGCHKLMDPIGFGFENFDPIGRYRTKDNGQPVDATGELDGRPFEDAADLAVLVGEHPDAVTCLVRKVYRHALGHVEGEHEEILVRELSDAWAEDGYRFRELLLDLVSSDGFSYVEGDQ